MRRFQFCVLAAAVACLCVQGAYVRTTVSGVASGISQFYSDSFPDLHLLPQTYFVNEKRASLFDSSAFPIGLRIRRSDPNILDFEINGVNKYNYRCAYKPQDSVVEWIKPSYVPTTFAGSQEEIMAERKVTSVFNSLQSISTGNSYLHFLAKDGTAVGFGIPRNTLPWCDASEAELRFDPSTYLVNNQQAELFGSLSPFPITVRTRYVQEGVMDIVFRGINTYTYRATYEPIFGTVSKVWRLSSIPVTSATAEQLRVEKSLVTIIENLRAIHHTSKLVTFVGDRAVAGFTLANGVQTAPGVLPEGELHFLPYDYSVGNKPAVIFSDVAFPITGTVERRQNDMVDLTYRGVNSYKYRINYNPSTLAVNRACQIYAPTQLVGTPQQLEVEKKITTLLDNVHTFHYDQQGVRLASTPDSVVAFGVPSRQIPFCGSIRCELTVNPSSYYMNSAPTTFYTGAEFPLSLRVEYVSEGIMDFYFKGVNTYTYRVIYSPVQRSVLSVYRIGGDVYTSSVSQEQIVVEKRVTEIVERLRSFEWDRSLLTLRSDTGSLGWYLPGTQVISQPQFGAQIVSGSQYGVKIYRVVPETYLFRQAYQPLFPSGVSRDLVVQVQQDTPGAVSVVVRGVNTMQYRIFYNNADGWVSRVDVGDRTTLTGDSDMIEAETKVRNVIANVQQIAFERDGRIQFITDNGSTRFACDLMDRPILY